MSAPNPEALVDRVHEATVRVLAVDDDPNYLELIATELGRHARFAVATASSVDDALGRLDGVDCVVSDHSMPTTGIEFLARIRERDEGLPFVLHAGEAPERVLDDLLAREWTDFQPKRGGPETFALLARRVSRLVDRRRTAAALRRATAGLEATRDGIAVVEPDGTVAFANGRYATAFGADREAVVGRHWGDRYDGPAVDRIATEAVPTAMDGWRWTGTCVGRDPDGEPVELRTSVVALEDGSLVFVVDPAAAEGESATAPARRTAPEGSNSGTEGIGSEADGGN